MNLGAAVQVLAYTVRMAMLGEVAPAAPEPGPRELPAAHAQLEGFYTQLGQTLDMIDFHKGRSPDSAMRKLRRLFGKAALTEQEVRLLRGILADAQRIFEEQLQRLGFAIDDKKLKHAGLDYWHYLDISYYDGLDDFFAKNSGPYYYFTTKAPQRYTDVTYPHGAYLVFGREDAGLPEALLAANQEHCIRMPMRDTCRSLNLSNSVAVGVYEVLRQWDFPELLDHGHLRDYEWK